ncbi:MAG: Rrf2 family transcriptional regulator [Anaerolineae bacterium]|nr:Rrf2 family transcriptional regulator [Anaerolineae bacterium]
MIELGLQEEKCVPSREISRRTKVSKAFLHKITADLVKADLIQTQSGPKGGLRLNHPLTQINLQQILEAVEGPICLNICLIRPQECERDAICPAHDFWGRLQTSIVAQLQAATLAELISEAHELKNQPRRRDHVPYLIHRADIGVIKQ